jgi:hypothetical protein
MVFAKMRHVNIKTFKGIMEVPALKDTENVEDVFTLSGEYAFGVFGWWKNKEEYGLWKTELIDELEKVDPALNLTFDLNEFVIWDFYKHRGAFKNPSHIQRYLKDTFR